MTNVIQQLEDLKEWSHDAARYERRLAFRGGQLVQPGPGRQGYAGKGTEQRTALSQWLKTQDKNISREALTKKVGKIWGTAHPRKITSYLLKENPEIFEDIKILSLSDVKGTTDFRNYLKTTKKRSTTVPQLVEDFKKATGKTVDANVGNIATEFSDKFNLATSKNIPPNKIEQKAINAYKKLSQEQKFAFQIGGPSQKGVYAKWLTEQGLDSGNTAQTRFRKLLEREGLYKKAPIKTSAEIAKIQEERAAGIKKSGATKYEEYLKKLKKETLKELGITADRVPFDQAHRLSYKQMARLGEKYTASNIGTDFYRTNTSAARKLEIALDPLYDKQYNFWKKAKKNPSKKLSKSLNKVNKEIAELVAEESNGRIQGIQIDPYNLKVGSTPINYKYAADFGTTKKPLSKITKGSADDIAIRLNYPEQIKREALESGLIKKVPKNFQKNINTTIERIGCPGLAAGGRASFKDGSTCYSKGLEKMKTGNIKTPGEKANFSKLAKIAGGAKKLGAWLFGPVEMGVLPLFLAGEGLYNQYANKRDLRKALERDGKMSKDEIEEIVATYGQESADLGDVGLEDWAIEQRDTTPYKDFLTEVDISMPQMRQDLNRTIEYQRALQDQEYQKQLEEAQREQFDPYAPMAGGGIANVRRPWAIPPESGPMPQGGGLSSQFNRVRKLTG